MKALGRYLICGIAGLLVGTGAAAWTVKSSVLGSSTAIGPWVTGKDFGVKSASARTRAIIALRGLLALPAAEARYYTSASDDAGRPLEGRCHYRLHGGTIPAKWWSVTLYDREGYLVPNQPGRYSVGSFSLTPAEQGDWAITISRTPQPGHWLPSGSADRFELSVRAYLPADGGKGDLSRAQLPSIVRADCA